MVKKHIRYANDHQAELGKLLRTIGHKHGLWQVFRDFVAIAALEISNATDKRHYATREEEYLKIVARYNKDEFEELARGFAHIVCGLEDGLCDFMGSLFMSLELGDAWKGQFFTPYEISRLMASITMGDQIKRDIERQGFVTVSDPCIGGGAMVIAAAHVMLDAGINYQQHMHAVAVDVDIVSVHMAYIQLSLLHIPAVIYHGNSLSMEIWSEWHTPTHTLGFWDSKLRRREEFTTPAPGEPAPAHADISIPNHLPKQQEPEAAPFAMAHPGSINIRGQIPLF
jgi:hypothetical protein